MTIDQRHAASAPSTGERRFNASRVVNRFPDAQAALLAIATLHTFPNLLRIIRYSRCFSAIVTASVCPIFAPGLAAAQYQLDESGQDG